MGVVIIAATFVAGLAYFLKQPMILGYILAGILVGPLALNLVGDGVSIALIAEIGIAFLLFIVGLQIDYRKMRDTGVTALVAGLGQVIITLLVSFGLISVLGFNLIEGFYVAVALTFSSTMIVVKLFADKQELDTLHGRIVIGILLVQDIVAIFLLAILPNIAQPSISALSLSLFKGIALFVLTFVAARWVVPKLINFVARPVELLFLSAVSWCFLFAGIAHQLGYSFAIGAFLAGVCLAPTAFTEEIIGRVKSLRDFFATIFFVSLGMILVISGSGSLAQVLLLATALSLLVLIGNPLIVLVIMSLLGHKKRTSFLTGLAVAQISEFSLIVIALGTSLGEVSAATASLVTLVAAITITGSTYMIKYDQELYEFFAKFLTPFEKLGADSKHLEYEKKGSKYEIVLAGFNRIGYSVAKKLDNKKKSYFVVDFNPELIRHLIRKKIPCMYGDIGDIEVVERMKLQDAKLLISTIPTVNDSLVLLHKAKQANPNMTVLMTATNSKDSIKLYQAGADYVIMPHYLGGQRVSDLLDEFDQPKKVRKTRLAHLKDLHERQSLDLS